MQAVLRAGGLFSTLGARRQLVYAAPDTSYSYEAMLALDENNPRRGLRKNVLDRLPTVRIMLTSFIVLRGQCMSGSDGRT
jgi:hypothetical protein